MNKTACHLTVKAGSAFGWLAFGAIVLLGALIGGTLWFIGPSGRADLLARHGQAVIGVPAAILVATAIVCAARALGGELKFAVLSANSTGAIAQWLPTGSPCSRPW